MLETSLQGLLENQIGNINIYTPLFEAIINAIHSIEESKRTDGKILIRPIRTQIAMEGSALPEIDGFIIEDNGVGFNKENLESFKTAYTQKKIQIGGKGFGRFSFLKVFSKVEVDSMFKHEGSLNRLTFDFWIKENGISVPKEVPVGKNEEQKTIVRLLNRKPDKYFDKQILTIARKITEHFLLYFAEAKDYFPSIVIQDGKEAINLNDYFKSTEDIELTKQGELTCESAGKKEVFKIKIFRIFFSTENNTVHLCAHHREVTNTALANFVPEFSKSFVQKRGKSGGASDNYVIKAYVLGNYLNENISVERNKFNFPKDKPDMFYPFSQRDIEKNVAEFAKKEFEDLLKQRSKSKADRINNYIDTQAPWYKKIRTSFDLAHIPEDIGDDELSAELHRQKTELEIKAKKQATHILDSQTAANPAEISELVERVTEIGKSDLIHYVANRKLILDLFEKSLKSNPDGKYLPEDVIHDIVFPRKKDSDTVALDEHNLWLLDERLNFHAYLTSDQPLESGARPDLVIYNKAVAMRGSNEITNPVVIFEFKKPQKEDFKTEGDGGKRTQDPIKQIADYAKEIRMGKIKTADGRPIKIHETTPFYGFVVCDLTPKARELFSEVYALAPSPDGEGYFGFHNGFKIYFEVMSFDKMLKDANLRNLIFFKKLGIS